MRKNTKTRPDSTGQEAVLQRPPFWREVGIVLGLFTLSAAMLCWVFPPNGQWPLAFVCLVPWAVGVCRTQRAWLVHWLSFLVGSGFFLVALRWMMPVTGLGYSALALYLGVYWTLAAWAIRTARRHGISPIWSLPIVWVACEYLRAIVITGFPWLFLSHGFHEQLVLIQISDLVGAYGVTFLAALVNGVLVELAVWRWPVGGVKRSARQLWIGTAVTVVLLVAAIGYGRYRLAQTDVGGDSPGADGPRVAVIQHDFPLQSTPPYSAHPYVVLVSYLTVGAEAAAENPDLIAFPETVWSAYQNIDFIEQRELVQEVPVGSWDWGRSCHEALSAFARGDYPAVNVVISELERALQRMAAGRPELNLPSSLPRLPAEGGPPVTVLVGAVSVEQFPEATYPKVKSYNSALVYDPDGTQRRQRYDKCHLVPFGEYVPFRMARILGVDMHWLYRWLNRLSPFSEGGTKEYSLTPGSEFTVFDLRTAAGVSRFGTPICYEDATPYVIREFVWDGSERRVDFIVSVSNDGWFQHSAELPQHLAICAFRAVENRVGIARAVNTGISGFIDSNGRIRSLVQKDGKDSGPGIVGYDIQCVPGDRRSSLYGRFGDWFALLCTGLAAAAWLGAVFERWVLALKQRITLLFGKRG